MAKLVRLLYAIVAATTVYLAYHIFISPSSNNPSPLSENIEKICYTIEGFETCPYFQSAKRLGGRLAERTSGPSIDTKITSWTRQEWNDRKQVLRKTIPGAQNHFTSPFVWKGCDGQAIEFVGGFTDFEAKVRTIN
ncbi:uncharacterized protein SPPG_08129 [Spizellomyces punctatus DAOM BR117]|uniref:Uncharacterized protein n=1 Tax=Spizellomyces punctatus (strain DAOM BR117) TaxID=645134 RepID=A0A0L0H6K8_SPIPD|nr:uncharacterized protein SPPG_08129 [Spizellomyces punctatus DAOM BR117]KNC96541.1 hypothetical protein SPPG_08129 [Spizellomyces punctatus DAOM BR117]|eukprot:XP_016604581.1 hypothetical protein SPPG_08129 [Spizellomyces punctatus DAOM BR117]